jgi:hypothetical protein
MSEPVTPAAGAADQAPGTTHHRLSPHFSVHVPRSWLVAAAVAVVMVLLALLGVGLTTASSSVASTYWVCLVPVYAMLCVGTAWRWTPQPGAEGRPLALRQVFHWLGIGAALGLDFYIRGSGEESGIAAGMNALLLLALGCYLAGVHLVWVFVPVGVLLTLALFVVSKADQYLWLVFVVGGLSVAGMLALIWLRRPGRHPGGAGVPPPVTPSAAS